MDDEHDFSLSLGSILGFGIGFADYDEEENVLWGEYFPEWFVSTHNYIKLSIVDGSSARTFEKHLRIFTRPYLPIAELNVNYEWVDRSDGENIYSISKIQITLVGFTGVYRLFIRDGYKNILWSEWGWSWKIGRAHV